jgi:triacylglycerol esterase/lipase EstA (alpha/beta hydrolase family)
MKHLKFKLQQDPGAFALLSKLPPKTAVVFVHGFWGKPRSTWVDFPNYIEQKPQWNECDLYFYGYRSNKQVRSLADDFLPFLRSVADGNVPLAMNSDYLPSGDLSLVVARLNFLRKRGFPGYAKLVLVGHSAGAVIIRETLLLIINEINAAQKKEKTKKVDARDQKILESRVRFFAPAHKGFQGAGILGIAQRLPVIEIIPVLCLAWNPLYQNLSRGTVLKDIEEETERLWNADKFPALNTLSLFGRDEEIVQIGRYQGYEDMEKTEPQQAHQSISKPRRGFTLPLEFVTDAL